MQSSFVKVAEIEDKIGYTFKNKELLVRAFTHTSYSNEHNDKDNYERFEFLGDAALGYVIGLYLYETYPLYDEGKLTKIRAGVVDRKTISEVVDSLDIIRYVRAGKGNASHDLASSVKVKCDIFEAIIGAIVIDNNNDLTCAKNFIIRFLESKIGASKVDYKSTVLEKCAKNGQKAEFVINREEKDNNTVFCAELMIDGTSVSTGEGHNIKSAEQSACKNFLKK